jgi:hypothetical protein
VTTETTSGIAADDEQITISDVRGASLVVERMDGGSLVAWTAAPGEDDGPAVVLDAEALERLAGFLGLRRVEPAFDYEGDELWLTAGRHVERLCDDEPAAVRRLYVEPAKDGGAS